MRDQIARGGNTKRINAFHVCDWLVPTTDLLLDRGMMGDGVIKIAALRQDVEAAGYAGFVETEIFSRYWWSQSEPEVLQLCGQRMTSIC